jgi:alanine-alpha-ketoisovalerate/valine-pyruvate aminotransferase
MNEPSTFSQKFRGDSGILRLMEDLGAAVQAAAGPITHAGSP